MKTLEKILSEFFCDHKAADEEAMLLTHFRRMDTAAQGIIAMTAERLAAG